MKVEALKRPLSIESVRDGGVYVLPQLPLHQTNLFLKVARADELYIKVPSQRGLDDYRNFIKLAQSNPEDVRALEDAERFERLEQTLAPFPGLKTLTFIDAEGAHYLAVHKLQYQRLCDQTAVGIPQARFGMIGSRRLPIFRKFEPVLFQERARGVRLWDMYDFAARRVTARWRPRLPVISNQLSRLLDSPLLHHVDWNIQNFIFDETRDRVFYVDLKPTTFLARASNEQNLKGIRNYFIV